jgi:hypothetical protein
MGVVDLLFKLKLHKNVYGFNMCIIIYWPPYDFKVTELLAQEAAFLWWEIIMLGFK